MAEEQVLDEKRNLMQEALQEEYLKSLDGIEDGQLVAGTVVQINNEYVFVDVGYKSEGRISTEEFDTMPEVGDEVKVIIVNKEGKGGQIIVSKRRADFKERTEELKAAAEPAHPCWASLKRSSRVDLRSIWRRVQRFCLSKAVVMRRESKPSWYRIISSLINSAR